MDDQLSRAIHEMVMDATGPGSEFYKEAMKHIEGYVAGRTDVLVEESTTGYQSDIKAAITGLWKSLEGMEDELKAISKRIKVMEVTVGSLPLDVEEQVDRHIRERVMALDVYDKTHVRPLKELVDLFNEELGGIRTALDELRTYTHGESRRIDRVFEEVRQRVKNPFYKETNDGI